MRPDHPPKSVFSFWEDAFLNEKEGAVRRFLAGLIFAAPKTANSTLTRAYGLTVDFQRSQCAETGRQLPSITTAARH